MIFKIMRLMEPTSNLTTNQVRKRVGRRKGLPQQRLSPQDQPQTSRPLPLATSAQTKGARSRRRH